jgi:hypothetical protein
MQPADGTVCHFHHNAAGGISDAETPTTSEDEMEAEPRALRKPYDNIF